MKANMAILAKAVGHCQVHLKKQINKGGEDTLVNK